MVKNKEMVPVEILVMDNYPSFRERCLNAISRMTVAPMAITVVEFTAEAVWSAMTESKADFVYIVSSADVVAVDMLEKLRPSLTEIATSTLLRRVGDVYETSGAANLSIFRRALPVEAVRRATVPLEALGPQEQFDFILRVLADENVTTVARLESHVYTHLERDTRAVRPSALKASISNPIVFRDKELIAMAIQEVPESDELAGAVLHALNREYGSRGHSISSLLPFFEAALVPVYSRCCVDSQSGELYEILRESYRIARSKDEDAVLRIMTGADRDAIVCLLSLDNADFVRYMEMSLD